MNRTHELKCWPEHFAAVRRREKLFEVRFDDRDYRVGDTLILREWIPPERWIEQYQGDGYTGETETVTVTYVLDDPRWCKPGYVVLGLRVERWVSFGAADEDVAEIEDALEKATPGEWERKRGMTVCDVLSPSAKSYIARVTSERNAHLIANAPTWLRQLLAKLAKKEAEIERLRAERDGYYNNAKYTEAAFHEVTRLRAELEKWEAEARLQYRLHNEMIEKERECREKLNQALEALEWIRDAGTDYQSISKARQALQSIRGDAP